jgi:hypothetical protein
VLRTGDRATVRFEFIARPEFVKEGMKLLFREGKTKVSCIDLLSLPGPFFCGESTILLNLWLHLRLEAGNNTLVIISTLLFH